MALLASESNDECRSKHVPNDAVWRQAAPLPVMYSVHEYCW